MNKIEQQIQHLNNRLQEIKNNLEVIILDLKNIEFNEINDSNHKVIDDNLFANNQLMPDFIPDWNNAPYDAICVTMDKSGEWYWWREIPKYKEDIPYKEDIWFSESGYGLSKSPNFLAGKATNAHLLPENYWQTTLIIKYLR